MKNLVLVLLLIAILFPAASSRPQNFWEQTNGPCGGNVTALAVNQTGDIFAGTTGGGILKSTDNGDSWNQVNNVLTTNIIAALAVNSSGIFLREQIVGFFAP